MPYSKHYLSKVIDLNDNRLAEKYQNEDFVAIFLDRYEEECVTLTFSYRDIKLSDDGKMTIYGFINSSYYEEPLKKTLQQLDD